jgi:hypothetical protein
MWMGGWSGIRARRVRGRGFLKRNRIGAEDDGGAVDGDVGVSTKRRTNHRFGGVCVGVSDVVGGEKVKG